MSLSGSGTLSSGLSGSGTLSTTTVSAVVMTANFSADNLTPNTGDTVTFTDLSDSSPTYWNWDFGDGTSSTLQNPTHSYVTVGSYTISLRAGGSGMGDDEVKTDYITVTDTNLIFGARSDLLITLDAGDDRDWET